MGNESGDAVFLSTRYGLEPDEWQENVLDGWMGVRRNGKWAAPRAGLACPRQNGKNTILEVRELYGMVILGERFLHTAHEVKTARKAFVRISSFFENQKKYPELAALVKEVRKTNGQEAIVLTNGGSIEFAARSKNSGRGFSVDVLVLDEAQELSEDAIAALLPTISASPNPQTIMTGTPPGPTATGDVFTRMRDAGVKGSDIRLCWHEWSCKEDADPDAKESWAEANPALGIRLGYDTTGDERASMDDDTFARERLGIWSTNSTSAVIDMKQWASLADPKSTVLDPVSFAIDVPPDRSSASIGIVGARPDGLLHAEVDSKSVGQRGTQWVVGRIVELTTKWPHCAVVIDAAGPAGSLVAPLLEAGVNILTTSTRELTQSCGMFYDAVAQGQLRHMDDPRLNAAILTARKRPLGDAWAWHRKDPTVDISPLVAVTLALFGFNTRGQREEPKKVPAKSFAFN